MVQEKLFLLPSRYSVVKFLTEKPQRSDVVPNIWLKFEEESYYCFYPKNASGERLKALKDKPLAPDVKQGNRYFKRKVYIKFRNGRQDVCEAKLNRYIENGEATGFDTDSSESSSQPDIRNKVREGLSPSMRLKVRSVSGSSSDSDSEPDHQQSDDDLDGESELDLSGDKERSASDEFENETPSTNLANGNQPSSGLQSPVIPARSPAIKRLAEDNCENQTPSKKKSDVLKLILQRLHLLNNKVEEVQKSCNVLLKTSFSTDPSAVVPDIVLPVNDPNILAKLEHVIKNDSNSRQALIKFLTSRGANASKPWDAVDLVFSSLLTNHCGHFINLHGNRAREGNVSESGRMGIAKITPVLFAAIKEVMKNISSSGKNISVTDLMKTCVTWLSKRTERLTTKPPLPWIFSSEINELMENDL